jgi:hypothetical protein
VRSLPSHSTPRGRPSGLSKAAKKARERARHRQWRNGGAAEQRPAISDQETAQGETYEHRGSKANKMRARRREKGERRGESTERSSPVSSAGAPTSNLRGQGHYHGEPRRARGARGGDGARSKMEGLVVHGGARNGQLR